MNLQNIFTAIEQQDGEIYERVSPRRDAIRRWAKGAALTALPFTLGSLFKKAYGQTNTTITNVLNFALTLEYLEADFYATGLASGTLIPASGLARQVLQQIATDEAAHVNFLRTTIQSLGATPAPKPTFDFTGGGVFADVFTNYTTFLAVAQAFEDTGVRAYKGQAPNLMPNPDVLTAALRIHSIEGRHAADIHLLRGTKAFIVLNQSGIPSPAVNPVYAGEENTVQANIEIKNLNGMNVSAEVASMAYDEPLTMAQVLSIVDPFIV
jgi:hypothetical protein